MFVWEDTRLAYITSGDSPSDIHSPTTPLPSHYHYSGMLRLTFALFVLATASGRTLVKRDAQDDFRNRAALEALSLCELPESEYDALLDLAFDDEAADVFLGLYETRCVGHFVPDADLVLHHPDFPAFSFKGLRTAEMPSAAELVALRDCSLGEERVRALEGEGEEDERAFLYVNLYYETCDLFEEDFEHQD